MYESPFVLQGTTNRHHYCTLYCNIKILDESLLHTICCSQYNGKMWNWNLVHCLLNRKFTAIQSTAKYFPQIPINIKSTNAYLLTGTTFNTSGQQ